MAEWVLLPVMVLSGTALFGAVFVIGGSLQFWARDAAQVQHAFTYGGSTLLRFPPTICLTELVRGVTFVLPLAFVNWVAALRLLGRDGPPGLPSWVDRLSRVVAGAMCAIAAEVWRAAAGDGRAAAGDGGVPGADRRAGVGKTPGRIRRCAPSCAPPAASTLIGRRDRRSVAEPN